MPSNQTTPTRDYLSSASTVFWNLDVDTLVQHCLQNDNCVRADKGAIVAYSGRFTGRTPKDKHTVREPSSSNHIWWENNHEMSSETFDKVSARCAAYSNQKELYVVDTFGGADRAHRISVRFIVERPYHALFIKQLLIRPTAEEIAEFSPDWHVVDFGKLLMNPEIDGTRSDAVIALNMAAREVLIAGTEYAGEMKKSVFTIMNYLLPLSGVLSMHCSANIGHAGDTALFFGLSGTGKTTLSADPDRRLIGDDEHGWTNDGVFNVEGGCYAKCINLSREGEPEIWNAIKSGAVLENVVLRGGVPNYEDASLTENTRCAYPIEYIENAAIPGVGGHPKNIVFLTCDALGVLPPISRLSVEQAMFYFLNGYTAKVAGTEAGVTEPTVVFSTCFGAPFLPLHPEVYAGLLGEKLRLHGSRVWLVNTGWTGGPYGVGSRIKLRYTRRMLQAAFSGELDAAEYRTDAVFGLESPVCCAGIDSDVLLPRATWPDPAAYDAQAKRLRAMFDENYASIISSQS